MDGFCQDNVGLYAIVDSENDSDSWKFVSSKVELPVEESKEYVFPRMKYSSVKCISGSLLIKYKSEDVLIKDNEPIRKSHEVPNVNHGSLNDPVMLSNQSHDLEGGEKDKNDPDLLSHRSQFVSEADDLQGRKEEEEKEEEAKISEEEKEEQEQLDRPL